MAGSSAEEGTGAEVESLRRENARLRSALEEIRNRLEEPEEILRAIRQGEIDALVVEEEGEEQIYALQQFGRAYRSMVEECFPYGVWHADPEGLPLYVSASFLRLLGTDLRALRERGLFHFLPPEGREPVEREWERCRASGAPFSAEYTISLTNGEERTVWARGLLAETTGGLLYWVGVNLDITERKKTREELQQQAEALQRQAEALRLADRRKDEFLALLGHELRNPLAPIRNGLHILLQPGVDAESIEQIKRIMEKQLNHLTRIVDDLLDVSRITRGRIHLRKERIELARSVSHALESVRSFVAAQGHKLLIELPPRPIHLEADPTRLEQILVNLLNNAAKYTPRGGSISLSAGREGDEAVIRIRDNGIGIPPELLPQMFDLFTQAEGGLDRSQGGLGIGLTLVRSLAEMHGGRVSARSEGPGTGAEFEVRLPALADDADSPTPSPTPRSVADGRRRILVVDDSDDMARTLQILLEHRGHETRVVHDGPAALLAFRIYQPDVVLLDVGLPEMSGYEVVRQLRAEPAERPPLIVAVSGYGQESDKRQAIESGFDAHITKPVDPDALLDLLAAAPRPALRPSPSA